MNSRGDVMKFVGILMLFVSFSMAGFAKEKSMNWDGLSKEKIHLGRPLLIVKGSKGFLACGYINVDVCNKTGEACAIVSGVKTHDDMLEKELKAVSRKAEELGLKVGMKGSEALDLLR